MNCSFCETTCRSRASFRRHLHLKHERDLVRTWENRRPVDRIVPLNGEQLQLWEAHSKRRLMSAAERKQYLSQLVSLNQPEQSVPVTGDIRLDSVARTKAKRFRRCHRMI